MQSRTRVMGILFLAALVIAPVAVLLHEVGHWVVAKAVGFQAVLHAYAVSGPPEAAPFGGNPTGVAAVALGVPAVSLAIIGALVAPLTWWSIIRRLDQSRWACVASLAAGTAVGMTLWLGPVGELVLP